MAEGTGSISSRQGERRPEPPDRADPRPAPAGLQPENQPPRPAAAQPRARRHPVSLGPGSPSGALINPAGASVHVKLWDVSVGGLCVVARGAIADQPGTLMTVELHAGMGVEMVRLQMKLVWAAPDEGNLGTFVGLQFPDGEGLPRGTFLDRLLNSALSS